MITVSIESKENLYVEVIDIPNAFIHTEQPENENFIKRLRERMDEIMCMIAQ